MEQHHRSVPVTPGAVDRIARDVLGGSPRLPVLQHDVPVHVAVAEVAEQARGREDRRARRRTGIGTRVVVGSPRRLGDGRVRFLHVRADPAVGQQGHPRMVVRVVADQVAVIGDPASRCRLRLGPASLDEERRGRLRRSKGREDAVDRPGARAGTVGVLGVERQRDARSRLTHGRHSRVVTFAAWT